MRIGTLPVQCRSYPEWESKTIEAAIEYIIRTINTNTVSTQNKITVCIYVCMYILNVN